MKACLLSLCVVAACGTATLPALSGPNEQARLALEQGRVDTAVALLQDQTKADPRDAVATRLLAQAYGRKGEFRKAVTLWEAVVARAPADGDALKHLGDLRFALGQCPAATLAYTGALAAGVTDSTVVVRLADCEVQGGKAADAQVRLVERLKKEPESSALHMALGRALRALQHSDQALLAYREAAKLAPDDPAPHIDTGTVYLELELAGKATDAFKAALALSPDHAVALALLGRALLMKGDMAGAASVLRKAAALNPDDVAVHNNLAVALSASGRADEAARMLEAATLASPDEPALYSNLAEAYYRLGRLADAAKALRATLRLAPKRPLDHAALRRIVLMEVILAERCASGAVPAAKRLEERIAARWATEGWAPGSYKADLAEVAEDSEAIAILDEAMKSCSKSDPR